MATYAERLDAALLQAPTTDSVRSALDTVFTDAETALKAVVVTTVGRSETGAEYIDLKNRLIEAAQQSAVAVADHT